MKTFLYTKGLFVIGLWLLLLSTEVSAQWMRANNVTVNNDIITASSNSSPYIMTSDPILMSDGGEFALSVLNGSHQYIYVALTDDVNSTTSTSTMDFYIKVSPSHGYAQAYAKGSHLATFNDYGTIIETLKIEMLDDKINYWLNGILFASYNGTIPEELYGHIRFTYINNSLQGGINHYNPYDHEIPWPSWRLPYVVDIEGHSVTSSNTYGTGFVSTAYPIQLTNGGKVRLTSTSNGHSFAFGLTDILSVGSNWSGMDYSLKFETNNSGRVKVHVGTSNILTEYNVSLPLTLELEVKNNKVY